MLSRAQEGRVRELLGSPHPGPSGRTALSIWQPPPRSQPGPPPTSRLLSGLSGNTGTARRAAGVACAYSYLIPVFAVGSAWIVLGEPITMAVVVCGTLIAAGVYLVSRA